METEKDDWSVGVMGYQDWLLLLNVIQRDDLRVNHGSFDGRMVIVSDFNAVHVVDFKMVLVVAERD